MLTFAEIKELIHQIEQSSIQYFELEEKKSKLVISKAAVSKLPSDTPQNPPVTLSTSEERIENPREAAADHKEDGYHTIVSPTVGTFYAAPEPGADPFVAVGTQIQNHTIVCVLEAMKLFNEVEAGVTGQVIELFAQDGDFIEYGQPLFRVKTAE